jgi:hypothetical protein
VQAFCPFAFVMLLIMLSGSVLPFSKVSLCSVMRRSSLSAEAVPRAAIARTVADRADSGRLTGRGLVSGIIAYSLAAVLGACLFARLARHLSRDTAGGLKVG